MCSPGIEFRKELEEQEIHDLKPYALLSKLRREDLGDKFRKLSSEKSLEYRTEYHRDRDRIVWSRAFKRLQHKTQIFPHYVEDHYRRRLTHSLEVAQIATTIARALGLNTAACEAIALGHDLGHTPFGHAGEEVLNAILKKETEKLEVGQGLEWPIPIDGFDHCVHAIEVITRIEQDYCEEGGACYGLDLTFDVRDGILKHMYDPDTNSKKVTSTNKKAKRRFAGVSEVVQFGDYVIYEDNKGSLEAQCVYFADKVAYLLSDIEDGIRCKILVDRELKKSELYKVIQDRYKKLRGVKKGLEISNHLEFRRAALTILILDCIKSARGKLKRNNVGDIGDVLESGKRFVFVSKPLKDCWNSFYQEWLVGKLFKHENVTACSYKAGRILKDLFNAYYEEEGLLKREYRDNAKRAYKKLGISDSKVVKLLTVRNYIAGMTDVFAIDQHTRLYTPAERVRF